MDSKTKIFKIAKCALGSILIGALFFAPCYHGATMVELVLVRISAGFMAAYNCALTHPRVYFGIPVTLLLFWVCAGASGLLTKVVVNDKGGRDTSSHNMAGWMMIVVGAVSVLTMATGGIAWGKASDSSVRVDSVAMVQALKGLKAAINEPTNLCGGQDKRYCVEPGQSGSKAVYRFAGLVELEFNPRHLDDGVAVQVVDTSAVSGRICAMVAESNISGWELGINSGGGRAAQCNIGRNTIVAYPTH